MPLKLTASLNEETYEEADDIAATINATPMFRGVRGDNGSDLTGLQYFISNEMFARTYGPVSQHTLDLKAPLVVSDEEWPNYATVGNHITAADVAALLGSGGYDSAVNIRDTPIGKLYTVVVLDGSVSAT